MTEKMGRSVASGWSVTMTRGGMWQWSAYGPLGGEMSESLTRADAERRAQEAERRLCRPVGASGEHTPRGQSERSPQPRRCDTA